MRKLSFFLCVLMVLVWGIPSDAAIRVEPSRFILHADPNQRITGAIEVRNTGSRDIELMAHLYDWTINEETDHLQEFPLGTLPSSLVGMVRFNPRQFSLEPGETQLVRFSILLPQEKTEMERRGIVFFEHTDHFNETGMGASVVSMVGTTIYVQPLEYELRFHLRDALVYRTDTGNHVVGFWVENLGDVHVRYRVHYRVFDSMNKVVDEHFFPSELVLLPQFSRMPAFPLATDLPPGDYVLLMNLHFSATETPLSHSLRFSIP